MIDQTQQEEVNNASTSVIEQSSQVPEKQNEHNQSVQGVACAETINPDSIDNNACSQMLECNRSANVS